MANPVKVSGEVVRVQAHGSGVYLVQLSVPRRSTRFAPGQFLHLTLEDFDPSEGYWPESRVFSIASPPGHDYLTVVYSVKGRYTARMERELQVGRKLWLKLPYGTFTISEDYLTEGPIVLVAGGTGVSPYMPFLMKRSSEAVGEVHLFYGVRKPEHLLFQDTWRELCSSPWFRFHLFVEDGAVKEFSSTPGRLNTGSILSQLGPRVGRGHYFLSGPPTMIKTFGEDLEGLGIPKRQVHKDDWE